jgi:NAD-dependent histone deacetylase SIR2
LKPCIVFFGEAIPKTFYSALKKDINSKCDLVIVAGSSLKVGGSVQHVLELIDKKALRILINQDQVTPSWISSNSNCFDASILGSCDDIATYLCELLGWNLFCNDNADISEASGEPDKQLSRSSRCKKRSSEFDESRAQKIKSEIDWQCEELTQSSMNFVYRISRNAHVDNIKRKKTQQFSS